MSKQPTSRAMPLAAIVLILGSLGVWEGLKVVPYRDKLAPGQPWTVCRGITGSAVIPGKRYSLAECDALESAYVARMATQMEGCIKQPLSVWEWVAWGDFAYNLGTTKFCSSTALKLINSGDRAAACAQITRWTYTNGKDCRIRANKCSGLVKRRAHQRATCERGL